MLWSTAEGVFCVACVGLPLWLVGDGVYDLVSGSGPVVVSGAVLQVLAGVTLTLFAVLYLRRPVSTRGETPLFSDYVRLVRGLVRRGQ